MSWKSSPGDGWDAYCRAGHSRNGVESHRRLGRFDLHEVRLGVSFAVEPPGHRQASQSQEFGVEELRLVAVPVVGEDGDDGLPGAELQGKADGAGDVHAGGGAETEALMFEEIEADEDRFLV